MKTNRPPKTWHSIKIPKTFLVTYATSRFFQIKLADRSRWEFCFSVYRTPKTLTVHSFILGRRDNERLSFPGTTARAQELIEKREWYSSNSGFDFCFHHENGFALLKTFLDELEALLASGSINDDHSDQFITNLSQTAI